MPCEEHELLASKYEAAMKTHSQNLQRVCNVIGCIPHMEFVDLWRKMQRTRQLLDEAQGHLLKHIAEHDCQTQALISKAQ
jgi:hemerythrin